MPTFRKITNKSGIRWRAEIHVNGTRESKRFDTKPQAREWALQREAELTRGSGVVAGRTFRDALERYAAECIPNDKKGRRWELLRIEKFKRDPIARVPVSELSIDDGREYVTRALETLKPNSVIREMNLIKPVVRKCIDWKWLESYPWDNLKMPAAGKARTKLYTQAEVDLIIAESGLTPKTKTVITRNQEVGVCFLFAIETAMRLGEIVGLMWENIDLSSRVAHLPDTKNGDARDVPLSSRATELLELMPRNGPKVFRVNTESASTLFRRLRRRAGINDGTFHDSRRLATSRLSEKLEVLELSRVTGHKDIKMLLTYYQKSAADIAKKLD